MKVIKMYVLLLKISLENISIFIVHFKNYHIVILPFAQRVFVEMTTVHDTSVRRLSVY